MFNDPLTITLDAIVLAVAIWLLLRVIVWYVSTRTDDATQIVFTADDDDTAEMVAFRPSLRFRARVLANKLRRWINGLFTRDS